MHDYRTNQAVAYSPSSAPGSVASLPAQSRRLSDIAERLDSQIKNVFARIESLEGAADRLGAPHIPVPTSQPMAQAAPVSPSTAARLEDLSDGVSALLGRLTNLVDRFEQF